MIGCSSVSVAVLQSSHWPEDGAACVFQLKGHITPVRTLAFSPDGLALASGGVGGLMNMWSLRVGHVQMSQYYISHMICNIGSFYERSDHVLRTAQ